VLRNPLREHIPGREPETRLHHQCQREPEEAQAEEQLHKPCTKAE
jgi:hypothetical protein